MKINVWTDGGAPGNPSPNSYGSFLAQDSNGNTVAAQNRVSFGFGTNNEAEFRAIILALNSLKFLENSHNFEIHLFSDSRLAISQIQGIWSCKSQNLENLRKEVESLKPSFKSIEWSWNPREVSVRMLGH